MRLLQNKGIAGLVLVAALFGRGVAGVAITESPALPGKELLSNGNFAVVTKDPAWPDDWSKKAGVSRQVEKGMPFLHFEVKEPGKAVSLFRVLSLKDAEEAKVLKVSVRYRLKDIKPGEKPDDNARIWFRFYDTVKIAFTPDPQPIVLSEQGSDWTTATTTFAVPEHAASLEIFSGLYGVQSGELDLAEISVMATSETAVPAGPVASADVPGVPIVRDGIHTIVGEGRPSVWFIHPYVDVVGHDFIQGLVHLVDGAREKGVSVAVGVAPALDAVALQDEANSMYVFTYKNINYPLPAEAKRLIFINTWLTPAVTWPAQRTGKKDMVLIGARMLNNNGDGLATDKARWMEIAKGDPSMRLTVLDSTGYYLPIHVWREAVLKAVLEERATR